MTLFHAASHIEKYIDMQHDKVMIPVKRQRSQIIGKFADYGLGQKTCILLARIRKSCMGHTWASLLDIELWNPNEDGILH